MRLQPLFLSLALLGLAGLFPAPLRAGEAGTPPDLHLARLTSPEIRAAVAAGYTSVLVPSGGTEQNGPHMILDKHNIIVGAAADRIAAGVGHMLIAPVLTLVPEGDFDPPSGNMQYPGTLGLTPEAYEGVLDGVARSLKRAGFRRIFFIGDHGQSQEPQAAVAERLSAEWDGEGVRVVQIGAYYDDRAQTAMLKAEGFTEAAIGFHAGLVDTAEAIGIRPDAVRPEVMKALPQPIDAAGGSGDPARATPELGRRLLEMRVTAAIEEIRGSLSSPDE